MLPLDGAPINPESAAVTVRCMTLLMLHSDPAFGA
jgi:hypothetical protein